MLVVVILLVIVFAIGRLGLRRYGMGSTLASYVAAGFVIAYAVGLLSARFFLPQNQQADVSANSSSPVPGGSTALRTLDDAALAKLKPSQILAPGAIDSLGIEPGTKTLTIYGWVGDPELRAAARSVIFIIDGKKRVDATPWYGSDRPDVATVYKTPAMEFTGVSNANISVADLSPGSHRIQVGAVSAAGDRFFVTSAKQTKSFVIKP